MKFWKRLRWAATIAFLALLIVSWFGIAPGGAQPTGSNPPVRLAPNFHP